MGGTCGPYGGEEEYRILQGKLRESGHLKDPGIDGRIVLRWTFRKHDVDVWTG